MPSKRRQNVVKTSFKTSSKRHLRRRHSIDKTYFKMSSKLLKNRIYRR